MSINNGNSHFLGKLRKELGENRNAIFSFLRTIAGCERSFLLSSDLSDLFQQFEEEHGKEHFADSQFGDLIRGTQEVAIYGCWIWFAYRPRIGKWSYVRFHTEALDCDLMDCTEYLKIKEQIVRPEQSNDDWVLEVDLSPFNRDFPRPREPRSIGRGVEFLNRHLSSRLFDRLGSGDNSLLNFLRVHEYEGHPLMLNERVDSVEELRSALRHAQSFLAKQDVEATWEDIQSTMNEFGFEIGWGRTVRRIRENTSILMDILEAPDYRNLATFLARIPMIFNIVILSPHGYFAQSDVLGLPDTGGQVIYILDQVRFLEKKLRERLYQQGLDVTPKILVVTRLIPESEGTTCGQPLEDIAKTENAKIMRVPFRDREGRIVPHWIPRFEVWPYIERFTVEVEKEVLAEFGGRPDVIIGNYSDGNLAASLLADRLKVTQCNIAHALEKTKYLYSDLYWMDNESQYHFSCQFTADLIAMNKADFIITSTFQEIAGDEESVGQYESYTTFAMPGLFRVKKGIDVYDPRFNIMSPGADPDVYFPFYETDKRPMELQSEGKDWLFGDAGENARGELKSKDKPFLFSMARLDRIKNLTGLVKWYGSSKELRSIANLVVIGGNISPDESSDQEEREQIHQMHNLFDEYSLNNQVRWIGTQLDRNLAGEIYRICADHRGAFVQPALFEAFGLTVIEAMSCGVPTFATRYGGPLEIIEDGISGFHIDPNHEEETIGKILAFLKKCQKEPEEWKRISDGGIQRVDAWYNWERYAEKLLALTCIYGFWKFVTDLDREETQRYLEVLYSSTFRRFAEQME